MAVDLPTCRVCFGQETENLEELISPCKCEGSQKYIHLSCLRRWQRTVQLGSSNHPEDRGAEDRHLVCNVCKGTFNLPPQDRGALLSDLAGAQPSDVATGLLLVTKRSAGESLASSSLDNLAIRAFLEAKAAHFRSAVYILTDISPGAKDGSDVVLGVNLSRSLEAPNIECLSTDVAAEQLDNAEAKGVELLWMNGGPVKPRHVHAMALLERLPSPACDSEDGVQILFEGEGGAWVAHGDLEEVLSVACEDATLSGKGAVIFAWAGYAQWSRTQLLGEMARGSWGWAPGGVDDVRSAIAAQLGGPSLWDSLRESQRLSWAPANELSRDFEKRFPSSPQPAAHDPQAQALSVLVNQFETLRRDTAASSDAEAAPPRRPRGCEQQ